MPVLKVVVSDDELAAVDRARGLAARSAWVRNLVRDGLVAAGELERVQAPRARLEDAGVVSREHGRHDNYGFVRRGNV